MSGDPDTCVSTNSGAAWITNNVPGAHWVAVSSSADGTRLAAATADGRMYISSDSGNTRSSSGTPDQQWQSVAWSASGNFLTGAASYGGMFALQVASAVASPTLTSSSSGNKALVAWQTNGNAGFRLQHNSSLATTNRTHSGAVPTLTNVFYQVSVPPTNAQDFFRLRSHWGGSINGTAANASSQIRFVPVFDSAD